jgi:hypothetical protein
MPRTCVWGKEDEGEDEDECRRVCQNAGVERAERWEAKLWRVFLQG